jgi:hypothetical protein
VYEKSECKAENELNDDKFEMKAGLEGATTLLITTLIRTTPGTIYSIAILSIAITKHKDISVWSMSIKRLRQITLSILFTKAIQA